MNAIPNKTEDRMVWLDLETFGLDEINDPIIEIGIAITDMNFNTLASESWLVWDRTSDHRMISLEEGVKNGDRGSKIVHEMHSRSSLFKNAAEFGEPPSNVEAQVRGWLAARGITGSDPMFGSTIDFDRRFLVAQMPAIDSQFHYRKVDVSGVKELCRRLNPEAFSRLSSEAWVTRAQKSHRALDDIADSINELKFYTENFLRVAR